MIDDAVRSSNSGFEAVNGSIHGCLRGWLAAEACRLRHRYLEEFGADCTKTLDATEVFALLLSDQGKLSEAKPLFYEVLHGRHGALGDAHPDTLSSLNNLASLLMKQGKLSEAESLYHEALRGRREALGDAHPDTLSSLNNLAVLLCAELKRLRQEEV